MPESSESDTETDDPVCIAAQKLERYYHKNYKGYQILSIEKNKVDKTREKIFNIEFDLTYD